MTTPQDRLLHALNYEHLGEDPDCAECRAQTKDTPMTAEQPQQWDRLAAFLASPYRVISATAATLALLSPLAFFLILVLG